MSAFVSQLDRKACRWNWLTIPLIPPWPSRRPRSLLTAIILAFFVQVALLRGIYAQASRPLDRKSSDFEVVIAVRKPLGAALGQDLQVQSFQRDDEGQQAFLEASGVQVGDVLVGINEEALIGLQPKEVRDIIQRSSLPFTLIFRPHDGKARDLSHMYSPQQKRDEDDVKSEGHVDLLDGPLSLFSVKAVRAKFGGVAQCGRKQLVYADPQDGCSTIRNEVGGKYVVLRRGNCSFTAKAMNIADRGAAGVLIINSEAGTFRMPHDNTALREGEEVDIPVAVVMLSKTAGDQVDKALKTYTTSLHARLVVTEECVRGEDDWHRVHDVAWKDDPHLHSSRTPPASKIPRTVVSAKGVAQKGVIQDEEKEKQSSRVKKVPEPPKGAAGVKWASREERQKRVDQANAERIAQGLRSGEIRVMSRNASYQGRREGDVAGMMSSASGVLVARAEFMGPTLGGAIPLGQRGIVYTGIDPNSDLIRLYPLPQPGDIAVMSIKEEDNIPVLLELAQAAKVSLVALVGLPRRELGPKKLEIGDFDRETQEYLRSKLELPLVELGRIEGEHVIYHLMNPESHPTAEVVNRPELLELWTILGELQDPAAWPRTAAQQQRLFLHLKQKHDPAQEDGSVERWRYLVQAFEKLGVASDLLQEL